MSVGAGGSTEPIGPSGPGQPAVDEYESLGNYFPDTEHTSHVAGLMDAAQSAEQSRCDAGKVVDTGGPHDSDIAEVPGVDTPEPLGVVILSSTDDGVS